MIEAPLYAATGKKSGNLALPADYFDGTVNEPVMHQAVKVFLSNQRQGTHATKTRRWVTGGNQKPWRQKGTGRARQGSTRSPLWPGGGTVFGPHPRDYTQDIPKKQRQLARRSALNARAREGSLWVVDSLGFEGPKTAKLVALLAAMGLNGQKVLILTNGINRNLYLSGRNLPSVEVMPYADASTYHILWSSALVVERGAVLGEPAEPETGAQAGSAESVPTPKRKAQAGKQAAATKAAAKRAKKPAVAKAPKKKPAAKKAAPKKKGNK
jgi:large subunit ribosomal protein L4